MKSSSVEGLAANFWFQRQEIEGAFWDIDFWYFDMLLGLQSQTGVRGDLLEIGALYGKSAIVLGLHAKADETVHICDIFEDTVFDGEANNEENRASYPGLTREKFERNYAKFVDRPAHVIQELSTRLPEIVQTGSIRFAHLDGGHLYDTVVTDIANVKEMLNGDGIVVIDDYRAMHTAGVAAATWGAVAGSGLVPFLLTEQKCYGTWRPELATAMREFLASPHHLTVGPSNFGWQSIGGQQVLLVSNEDVRSRSRRFLASARSLTKRKAPNAGGHPHLGAKHFSQDFL